MRILFLLLLTAPLFGYCQSESFLLKHINDNRKIEIINTGLDLNATFVPVYEEGNIRSGEKNIELKQALLKNGFRVGDYYDKVEMKDSNNRETILSEKRIFNGRYAFIFIKTGFAKGAYGGVSIYEIKDLENNNKTVTYINIDDTNVKWRYKFKYHKKCSPCYPFWDDILKKLIESNK